ncbi:protease modulator HflK [Qipengyuania citrea]|jgi:membrane protease subunit HflK|uniref:Protease modulator HflK n=3 Tax=Erythrobacteraceae TaxID=335929 RepID=A0ABY4UBS5_9SPHN|nr:MULTISPECIES: protease modulator HflK [Qipengyuania]MAB46713.1 protease modulator HflK [Sphingomonadaceae bacterium]MBL4896652.1 protease modulator HflK [Erythrobacter sp.]MEC7953479.1 protease modulator HflK [Pseudomonadota bacterium]PNQ78011.1 protease modulator HflK [Erythrobacter sp. SAORIC-644]QPL39699.1 protease modulator HflK [Erythrobacter sp. A30-3]|tara:strand:+ start:71 stop:1249 length:1179 start_codon:yes stop_codon:yes gene_type:complete
MRIFDGFGHRISLAMAGKKSPWGGGSGDDGDSDGGKPTGSEGGDKPKGPRNPWLPPGSGGGSGDGRRGPNIEDIFKSRGPEGPRRRGGGGGGPGGPNMRFPQRPGGKSWFPIAVIAIIGIGVLATSVHLVGPQQQAVVKTLGNYTRAMQPGLNFSAPFPIETVEVEDVEGVRSVRIPGNDNQAKLILTGDQNLVDLSYIVRWNIKDLSDFKFRVVDPVDTVNEAAEAAMRAAVAETELDETFSGQGRAAIELDVRERMQRTLDGYRAGVNVLGVEIEKADPPAQVVDAFRDVQVAEQNADAARNQARGYAQQVLAQAQGEAEAFDKVYQQYRLAPQVTRQRLYYETMERVLSQTDKTIVETGNVTPYLPLPEIRRRAQQSSPATVVTAPEGQ